MFRPAVLVLAAALLALGTGCESSSPSGTANTSAEQAKPAPDEAQTGRAAFQKLFTSARLWAPDAQPFRLQSGLTPQSRGQGGKAAVWLAGFASPSKGLIRTFTWSGSHDKDAPEFGISPSPEDSYSPTNSSTAVFDVAYLKTDSEQAYKVAQEHGGARITAKDPKQPVVFLLDWDPVKTRLLWHVLYGAALSDAKLKIAVSATTGAFVRVEE